MALEHLHHIAPSFVAVAHGIGMAVVATVDRQGRPRTRVMQPVWAWDGTVLRGWVSTTTDSPKASHVLDRPAVSITYWQADQSTATADCEVRVVVDHDEKVAAWERFRTTPAPAGFDPMIHPDWEHPGSPTFGLWELEPHRLRVMPGTLMTDGVGELLTWRRARATIAGG